MDNQANQNTPSCGPDLTPGLPPEILATPSDLRAGGEEEIQWWTPDWRERLSHVGWRWVLIVPAVGLAVLGLALLVYMPRRTFGFVAIELKLVKLVIAICVPVVLYAIRKAAHSRT